MSVLFFNTELYHSLKSSFSLQYVLLGLMLAFAGWLADVYFGCYKFKVICLGIWMMWISLMLATLGSVSAKCLDRYYII